MAKFKKKKSKRRFEILVPYQYRKKGKPYERDEQGEYRIYGKEELVD